MRSEQRVDDPDEAIRTVMANLAASAREANLARAAVLEDAVRAAGAGVLAAADREAAVAAAHQVVGSAGTFGRRRSSELAADLEQWFRRVGERVDERGLDWVRDQLAALQTDLAQQDGAQEGGAHQDER